MCSQYKDVAQVGYGCIISNNPGKSDLLVLMINPKTQGAFD